MFDGPISEDTWREPHPDLPPCTRGTAGSVVPPILGGVPEESFVMSHRLERVLAYMVAGIIVLSLASFVALLVGTSMGLEREDFTQGLWPVVTILPLIGLPIGFVLIIALLVVSAVRRGRAVKDAGN